MKSERVIKAQLEILQGYYNRLMMNPETSIDTILNWLEDDIQTVKMDNVLLSAKKIINKI